MEKIWKCQGEVTCWGNSGETIHLGAISSVSLLSDFCASFCKAIVQLWWGGGVHIFVERFIKCCDSAVWVVLLSRLIFLTSGINSRSRMESDWVWTVSCIFSSYLLFICYNNRLFVWNLGFNKLCLRWKAGTRLQDCTGIEKCWKMRRSSGQDTG